MANSVNLLYKSSYILILYVISVVYVVLGFIWPNVSYVDELICILIFFYGLYRGYIYKNKEFICFVGILCLYLVYSLLVKVNVYQAVGRDFLQFLKPFVCFYVVSSARITITKSQKKFLSKLSIALILVLVCIAPFINTIYSNTISYYYACITAAIMYYTFSEHKKKDIIFLIFLLPGLLSFRAKYVSEIVLYIYILFFLMRGKNQGRISLKTLLSIVFVIIVAIILNREKFAMYFITGVEDGMARSHLYSASFKIFKDYFPFGSGLGTFGTDASALYYSPLYYKYDLYNIFGCRPEDYGTAFSFFMDTFYPIIIAQFGAVGLYLFFLFWKNRWKFAKSIDNAHFKLFLLIMGFEAIEGIAGTAFLSSTGIPAMICMGISCNRNVKLT